jgi:hypothetical protein
MTQSKLVAAAVAMALFSLAAHAWWDNIWTDDYFGDGIGAGDFGFGFSLRGRGQGYGRGYAYDTPYWGYAPYYPPYYAAPAPPPLTEQQRAAMVEQQKAYAEEQKKAFQQAVAAQREYAERLSREMMAPAPELPADIKQRMQQHEAQREALLRGRESSYSPDPQPANSNEELYRRREDAQMRHGERLNKLQQYNPVMTQPDIEM